MPLSKGVGTSFVGGLEDKIPTRCPTQRQRDGQVNLRMGPEEAGQEMSCTPIHMLSLSRRG